MILRIRYEDGRLSGIMCVYIQIAIAGVDLLALLCVMKTWDRQARLPQIAHSGSKVALHMPLQPMNLQGPLGSSWANLLSWSPLPTMWSKLTGDLGKLTDWIGFRYEYCR